MVRSSLGTGIASVLPSPRRVHEQAPVEDAGSLGLLQPHELAFRCLSGSPVEASIGLAAVNSLLLPDGERTTQENARELMIRRAAGGTVALVGRFPFVDALQLACDEAWVFEREPLCPDEYGTEEIPELMPLADVVAVSAATLMNHTLDSVLPWVRRDAFLMMLGPSTPLCPCLFELGFDVLCGTVVDDPDSVARIVSQGGVTSQIAGVRRVCLWAEAP
jgi:uncharacterized protein (DUF4213/DUF364 family)